MLAEFEYKTDPFKHQDNLFHAFKDLPAWATLWEQGCGKTKPSIDKTAYLYLKGEIDALVVVAPNGVDRNWQTDELPLHMPDSVRGDIRCFRFDTNKAENKSHKAELERLINHKGLAILLMSYDAVMTKKGHAYLWKFLRQRRCYYVLDEAHYIKSPGAKRTKRIIASGNYAPFKSLLTGTPVATGPFDIYSQIKFLDDFFWNDRGLGTFAAFKQYFGVWLTAEEVKAKEGYDPGYDQLVEYKNLDKLYEILQTISDRLTKDDAGLDLPPKLYSKRYFDMTPKQSKAYKELAEEYWTELEDGTYVEASLAIVRLLRLQQITCGYVAAEAEEPLVLIDKKNPRLDLALEICEPLPHKAIIWSRFTKDIDQLMDALGKKAVRYDGKLTNDEKAYSKEEFQKGDAQFFIGNSQAGATGLTLHAARTVMYYSNSFNFTQRLQSEDRAHRIGQEHPVDYIDLIAQGTIDHHLISSFRNKYDIASQITGDTLKEWL